MQRSPEDIRTAENWKATAGTLLQQAWGRGDTDAVESHTTRDFTAQTPLSGGVIPKDEYKSQVEAMRGTFKNSSTRVREQWCDGQTVITKFETSAETRDQRQIKYQGISVDHIEDGLVRHEELYFDSWPVSSALPR